jgi:hypothetical protein
MTRRLPLDGAEGIARCLNRRYPCINEGMRAFWSMCYGGRT